MSKPRKTEGYNVQFPSIQLWFYIFLGWNTLIKQNEKYLEQGEFCHCRHTGGFPPPALHSIDRSTCVGISDPQLPLQAIQIFGNLDLWIDNQHSSTVSRSLAEGLHLKLKVEIPRWEFWVLRSLGLADPCLSLIICKMGLAQDLLHLAVVRTDGDDACQVVGTVTGPQ